MLKLTVVAGNIHDQGGRPGTPAGDGLERLRMSRTEMQRSRIRRHTTDGTDVGIILEAGTGLRDGDILSGDGKAVMVEQLPEKVITARLKSDANPPEMLVMMGHIIGNRHRPISFENGAVSFPIQADAELDIFRRLLSGMADRIEMYTEEKIFTPHAGADVHDHR